MTLNKTTSSHDFSIGFIAYIPPSYLFISYILTHNTSQSQLVEVIVIIFHLHLGSSRRIQLVLLLLVDKFQVHAQFLIIFPYVYRPVFLQLQLQPRQANRCHVCLFVIHLVFCIAKLSNVYKYATISPSFISAISVSGTDGQIWLYSNLS